MGTLDKGYSTHAFYGYAIVGFSVFRHRRGSVDWSILRIEAGRRRWEKSPLSDEDIINDSLYFCDSEGDALRVLAETKANSRKNMGKSDLGGSL